MAREPNLILVNIGNGQLVWHTREQWVALWCRVDREACEGMTADIGGENET